MRRSRARRLFVETLAARHLMAGDIEFVQSADILSVQFEIDGQVYHADEATNPMVDVNVGQTIQITGIDYVVSPDAPTTDGVIAFEIYRRREHGALTDGSFDYTDGRFGDPIENSLTPGPVLHHEGVDEGWIVEDVDNRIAVVAIRYVGDSWNIEDRFYIDIDSIVDRQVNGWASQLDAGDRSILAETNRVQMDSSPLTGGEGADGVGVATLQSIPLPGHRYEVAVNASSDDLGDYANGFIILDYHGENDFVYAGMRNLNNQWVIGHFDGQYNDLAITNETIDPGRIYHLRVAVDGQTIALAADGVLKTTATLSRDLSDRPIGLGNQRARTEFTDLQVFQNDHYVLSSHGQTVRVPDATVALANELSAAEAVVAKYQSELTRYQDNMRSADQTVRSAEEALRAAIAEEQSTGQSDDGKNDRKGKDKNKDKGRGRQKEDKQKDSKAGRAVEVAEEAVRQAIADRQSSQSELDAAQIELDAWVASERQLRDQYDQSIGDLIIAEDHCVAYALNFNHQLAGSLHSVSGSQHVVAGQVHLVHGDRSNAISLLQNETLPERTETRMYATVHADSVVAPGGGELYNNGFIIFDYQSPTDFKYAGAWAGRDQWAIGHYDGTWNDDVVLDETIGEGPAYELQVWVQDNHLSLIVGGNLKLTHQFDEAVDDGSFGLGGYYSQPRFDQVAVMQLHGGDAVVDSASSGDQPASEAELVDAAITTIV